MYHDRMCQGFINLMTELLTASLITFVSLLIVLGKQFEWGVIVDNVDLVAISLNWVLILPLSINFFMFNLANSIKGMSSAQRIFDNIEDELEEKDHNYPKAP